MPRMADRIAIRMRLVGRMGVWTVAGECIVPPRRSTRALLAAIALSAPRPVSRGWLSGLLWSQGPIDPRQPPLRLEVRRLLDALAPAGKGLLSVDRESLSLRPGAARIDVEEIRRATPEQPAMLSLLDRELLEDLDGVDPAFDHWLRQQREQLHDRAKRVAEARWLGQTEPADIVPAARRLLFLNPVNEKAWRGMMRAYAGQTDIEAATEAFEQCGAALRRELDTEPSAETRALLAEIREQKPLTPNETIIERPSGPEWNAPRVGPRIGVLPIDCVRLPEEETFLGPGIAREITERLSRFFRIVVTDAEALARFARDSDDAAAIRRVFGIDYLMRGTIQRDRGRLRVSLRLLDLRGEDRIVWADRFDRATDDLLAAQQGIAADVVARVEPELQMIEALRNPSRPRGDLTANDLVIMSIPPMLRMERAGFMQAGGYLEQGVALEPNFCDVHGWYSFWHVLLVSQGWTSEPRQALARGGELAERAVTLNPMAVRALTISGLLRALQGYPLSESAALYDHALDVNPNLAMTWALSAVNCFNMGDIEEAQRRYDTYKSLSPHDRLAFFFDAFFAPIHLIRRDYHAAITTGHTLMQLNPAFSAGYKPHLAALGHLRHHEEAAALLGRLLAIEPNFTVRRFLQTTSIRRQSDRDHFVEGLRLAGVRDCSYGKPS